jgi:hypothetical protein
MPNKFTRCFFDSLSAGDYDYHFSWVPHPDRTFNWSQGRKYCKGLGMELIAMETADKWQVVKDVFHTG